MHTTNTTMAQKKKKKVKKSQQNIHSEITAKDSGK